MKNMLILPPFNPTACSCKDDRSNCKRQPGHLIPGQLAEIVEFLKVKIEDAGRYFWNSPGMVLMKAGQTFRVRTITPRMVDGACVFYKNRRCTIHALAPFGCRYFDVHMDRQTALERSSWGARQILEGIDGYAADRDTLPEATSYRPTRA